MRVHLTYLNMFKSFVQLFLHMLTENTQHVNIHNMLDRNHVHCTAVFMELTANQIHKNQPEPCQEQTQTPHTQQGARETII